MTARTDRPTMAALLVLVLLALAAMISGGEEPADPLGEGVECYECGKMFLWDSGEAVRDLGREFCCPECAESYRANVEGIN